MKLNPDQQVAALMRRIHKRNRSKLDCAQALTQKCHNEEKRWFLPRKGGKNLAQPRT